MTIKALLVEDEENFRQMLQVYLQANGISVIEAENGSQAKEILAQGNFDVIILDIMMPVMDGFAFLEQYTGTIPILVISAKSQTEDKLRGFQFGIDDYLTKPFDLRELVARIQVLVRRSNGNMEMERPMGTFLLDRDTWKLIVQGKEMILTPKEFEILDILFHRPERVFTRDELLIQVWGNEHDGDERVVDTHVKNIREKFRKAHITFSPIETVWGVGYRFGGSEK
ncbi:response regulator transcription factor [Effusibacillus dendaii]|uniref:Heme response regulator HssR n=1 Tax=Effusibacillus dendaii TaxID=2743772 RepID=A0A7I8DG46_9BACL|nr:response regulator transcription factor [Effusibacillus dendaii]BCJ88292.1 DNA-binding response regulator [Effusibacillus dendaii]